MLKLNKDLIFSLKNDFDNETQNHANIIQKH